VATAKKLGFKKGDWALLRGTQWPAKLISDVHTSTPVAMVFGWESEAGSVYAHDLVKISYDEQVLLEEQHKQKIKVFKTPLTIA
jgi:hypothetical protein